MPKQVVLRRPKVIEVEELPPPQERPGHALVSLRLAGICGSDLAAYRGLSPLARYPLIPGHELLVDVQAASGRTDMVGKRAVIEPLLNCGLCVACRSGKYNACTSLQVMGVHVDGGLRHEMWVREDRIHPIPDELPDELAVLAEPAAIAYRAVQRGEVEAGTTAVVFGAGTIGLLITQLLIRARGCHVMVVDRDEWRLSVAAALGASVLLSSEHLADQVAAQTSGEMAARVFEATGHPDCTLQSTQVVGVGGRIILIGWNEKPPIFDTITFMRKEAEVFASRNSLRAFPAVLRLLRHGVIDGSQLVTHRFELANAASAFELLDQGGHALKILIAG